jgi:hypothetical protein
MKQTAGIMCLSIAAAKGRLFHAKWAPGNCMGLGTACRAESTRRASRLGVATQMDCKFSPLGTIQAKEE